MSDPGAGAETPPPPAAPDPLELLKSRSYVALLVMGAVIGVPVATFAFFFLKGVSELQHYVFTTLPADLGFNGEPVWWPLPWLALCGLLVALAIVHLPGTGGHEPSEGFKSEGPVEARLLPGIFFAAFATLGFGAVLGPEAPLIALGSGLGVLILHFVKRDAPAMASVVIGAAGSFAAISTLLGSPITGAFLLMEVAGLAGPMLGIVLTPGLVAAGVGSLIFVGLDSWTGFGTFGLAVPNIPHFGTPDVAEFLWALGIGVAAAVLGTLIRRSSLFLAPFVGRRRLLLTPVFGLAVAGLAIVYGEATSHSSSQVLFSGQDALSPLIQHAADYTAAALALLVACKALAYAVSLSAFRGGPIFPAMFIGAAGGIALSHLPGLPLIAGVGMGIGAMSVAMLRLPLTSVLLATLLLETDSLTLMPLVIVAVVVSYVVVARLDRPAAPVAAAGGAGATAAEADPRDGA
jgi:chloride channel protein, CIC family